jgi:hypothetical protein
VAVVLVVYAQAQVSCWLKALLTQLQSVLAVLIMPMAQTQFFLQSPQRLVAEGVEHLPQQPQTQVVRAVAVLMVQLLAALETRLALHHLKVTMVAQLLVVAIQVLEVVALVQ